MKDIKSFVIPPLAIVGLVITLAVGGVLIGVILTKAANSSQRNAFYYGNFTILNVQYHKILAENNTVEFLELRYQINKQLNLMYSKSDIAKQFGYVQVVEFRSGSVQVTCVLHFKGNRSTLAKIAVAVEEIFRQSLTHVNLSSQTGSLDQFIIDLGSIEFHEISTAEAGFHLMKVHLFLDFDEVTSTSIPTTLGRSPTCGFRHPVFNKIDDGTDTVDGEWPWQVSLQINSHICGASIISNRWLVSAAHCFQKQFNNTSFWKAHVGSVSQNGGTVHKIKTILNHPRYGGLPRNNYDITLLELSKPINFSGLIQPICLPRSSQEIPDNRQCTITGWGFLASTGKRPTILQEAEVIIINNQTCNMFYGPSLTPEMLCANFSKEDVDSCQGDSGGPLVCMEPNGTWFLAGIVSFTDGCTQHNFPGVYTRVTAMREWIHFHTGV